MDVPFAAPLTPPAPSPSPSKRRRIRRSATSARLWARTRWQFLQEGEEKEGEEKERDEYEAAGACAGGRLRADAPEFVPRVCFDDQVQFFSFDHELPARFGHSCLAPGAWLLPESASSGASNILGACAAADTASTLSSHLLGASDVADTASSGTSNHLGDGTATAIASSLTANLLVASAAADTTSPLTSHLLGACDAADTASSGTSNLLGDGVATATASSLTSNTLGASADGGACVEDRVEEVHCSDDEPRPDPALFGEVCDMLFIRFDSDRCIACGLTATAVNFSSGWTTAYFDPGCGCSSGSQVHSWHFYCPECPAEEDEEDEDYGEPTSDKMLCPHCRSCPCTQRNFFCQGSRFRS